MDPVPHIYSYLKQLEEDVPNDKVEPITDNEVNEIKNLRKKIEYYKEILNEEVEGGPGSTNSSEEDEDESEEEDIQPKKKNIKKQRQGVSAEVYGEFNKKGNYVPKVVQKSASTRQKLCDRLL